MCQLYLVSPLEVGGAFPGRLEAAGDTERAAAGTERVLAGTGATRQRAAYERTGTVEGVVDDLLARTRATWQG